MLMRYELGVQENWKNLKIQEIEAMISKPVFANDNAVVVSGGGEKKQDFVKCLFPILDGNPFLRENLIRIWQKPADCTFTVSQSMKEWGKIGGGKCKSFFPLRSNKLL